MAGTVAGLKHAGGVRKDNLGRDGGTTGNGCSLGRVPVHVGDNIEGSISCILSRCMCVYKYIICTYTYCVVYPNIEISSPPISFCESLDIGETFVEVRFLESLDCSGIIGQISQCPPHCTKPSDRELSPLPPLED